MRVDEEGTARLRERSGSRRVQRRAGGEQRGEPSGGSLVTDRAEPQGKKSQAWLSTLPERLPWLLTRPDRDLARPFRSCGSPGPLCVGYSIRIRREKMGWLWQRSSLGQRSDCSRLVQSRWGPPDQHDERLFTGRG